MTLSDQENPPTYTGMLVGGWAATAAGGIGLPILLTVGVMSKVMLPTGFAALAMGAIIVGTILLVGRLVLCRFDDHKADHQRSAVDLNDIVTIRKQVADVLAIVARWDLERAQERKMVAQIEEFMAWRERATQRAAEKRAAEEPRRKAGEPGWAPTDDAWMGDVAEAFELGKTLGGENDQDQTP
jgi:hypothetical protein